MTRHLPATRLSPGKGVLLLLAALAAATPAPAQTAGSSATVGAIERAVTALVQLGIDPQSAKLLEIREKASLLKALADQIRTKKESNDGLRAKIKALKAEAELNVPEITRLRDLRNLKLATLNEELKLCLDAGDAHDKRNRRFKTPDEDAERAAYNAEAERLKKWHDDILVRLGKLDEDTEALRLAVLMARGDEIRAESALLEGRLDDSIQGDLRAFDAGVEEIKGLIAALAKPLQESHVRKGGPRGAAWQQLGEVVDLGGRRFDTPVPGDNSVAAPDGTPPPDVASNVHYRELVLEQQRLEARIKDLRTKVFDPLAPSSEVQAAVKSIAALESLNLGVRIQIRLMTSASSLPASATPSKNAPLRLPERKY